MLRLSSKLAGQRWSRHFLYVYRAHVKMTQAVTRHGTMNLQQLYVALPHEAAAQGDERANPTPARIRHVHGIARGVRVSIRLANVGVLVERVLLSPTPERWVVVPLTYLVKTGRVSVLAGESPRILDAGRTADRGSEGVVAVRGCQAAVCGQRRPLYCGQRRPLLTARRCSARLSWRLPPRSRR